MGTNSRVEETVRLKDLRLEEVCFTRTRHLAIAAQIKCRMSQALFSEHWKQAVGQFCGGK